VAANAGEAPEASIAATNPAQRDRANEDRLMIHSS
jgi:hypothetical protein